ncbi:DUF5676 family membrane protein [Psychrobacter sp. N25K4-3-2]|uniref:DUF5676 family membrane protein n=1 Tax=unclassified Psychrobacter TaxID=196806 RepID=UPI00188AFC87|nr:DUF5676 family membrane protein [Psychrobacter sp. N25K4-3-2]MBF4490612.1 hypothetical protein [Psychrobacter sp. N25K4-3-2]
MNEVNSKANTLGIGSVGNSVSLFLLISYLLCIGFGLLAPEQISMHEAWAPLLPGFEWLTWSGFLIGFVESYLYGWYFAIVFVPLYRWFAKAG